MLLIEPSVEIIEEKDPFKKIELAGRTCYKSESQITDASAIKFYNRLVDNKHTAMLEHATFVFEVDGATYLSAKSCHFLNCTQYHVNTPESTVRYRYLVSGNLRAINESGNFQLCSALAKVDPKLDYLNRAADTKTYSAAKVVSLSDYSDLSEAEISAHRYTTMRFICDRGVTHEFVRHRCFSFAQESTRYVNYSKLKDMYGIRFIRPAQFHSWNPESKEQLTNALSCAEMYYHNLIKQGHTPDEARAVLPNALKTEIVVTGNDKEWQHFFNLRSKGTTGKPNPEMKKVADIALDLYTNYYEIN